jgi:hypothetical protein
MTGATALTTITVKYIEVVIDKSQSTILMTVHTNEDLYMDLYLADLQQQQQQQQQLL